jgi:hypothetical protein
MPLPSGAGAAVYRLPCWENMRTAVNLKRK